MVNLKISSAQRKSRGAEKEQRRRERRAPEAEKSYVFFSAFSAPLLFLCADEIFNPA
jgi:hypothetical protein